LATIGADEAPAAISQLTEGRGLDVLTFTAGTQSLLPSRLKWLRGGGTLNIFSELKPDAAASPIDFNEVYHRELTILSSYSSSLDDLKESLALLAAGAINVKPLTLKTYGLDAFAQAVAQTKSREIMKAILIPGKTKNEP
jgi:L-iditol 2-dehydrogenase